MSLWWLAVGLARFNARPTASHFILGPRNFLIMFRNLLDDSYKFTAGMRIYSLLLFILDVLIYFGR